MGSSSIGCESGGKQLREGSCISETGDYRRGRLRWEVVTSSAFVITLKCLLDLHVELLNRQLYHTSTVQGQNRAVDVKQRSSVDIQSQEAG